MTSWAWKSRRRWKSWQHCADVIREEKGIENPWIHQGAIVSYWPMFFEETYAQTSGNDSIAKTEDWLSGNSSFVNDETIEAFAMIGDLFERNILTTDSLNTDETWHEGAVRPAGSSNVLWRFVGVCAHSSWKL